MNNGNIKTVAIYTRVSTEDQAKEGFSLDSQLERLQFYCKSMNWNVQDIYVDPGFSGRNTRRPAYKKMFDNIDKWDGILVIKMDRIHRNSKNFIKMMEVLSKNNKEFISQTESLDTSTAMGRFVMDIIQRIAQLESEQIGERTFIAMQQKQNDLSQGFMGHGIPFGYKQNGTGDLIEIPEQIQAIKKMFELYETGLSTIQISKGLGINQYTVGYVIKNTFYAGFEQWLNMFKKTSVEPIISREFFNKVQIRRSQAPCGKARLYKPFQLPLDPKIEFFKLTPEEMEATGFWKHRPKHIFH